MTLWLLLGASLWLALAYGAVALYVADLFTRSKRRRVEGTPGDLGLRYEDVRFASADGTALRGWFLDSPGARANVVMVHDGDGTRADADHGLLSLQREYVRHRYNVFAFDLRGRGESSGVRDRLGSAEQGDLAGAIAYVRSREGQLPLVLHGFGLGGSLAISVVASEAAADLVIADSPFASAREQLRSRWPRVPGHLFRAACWIARRLYRADVEALSPLAVIAGVAPTPVLLIHGDADNQVPVANSLNLAAATLSEETHLWTVDGVGHCGAYLADPQAYFDRCLMSIERAVPTRLLATAG